MITSLPFASHLCRNESMLPDGIAVLVQVVRTLDFNAEVLPWLDKENAGRGGFARVHKANLHDREVVVKIPVGKPNTPVTDARTFGCAMELFTLSVLPRHPNIVQLLCLAYPPDTTPAPALIFTRARGGDLLHAHASGLSQEDTFRVLIDGAKGLQHAHAHGVVHSDIKPDNILLDGPGGEQRSMRGLLADFGLSQRLPAGTVSKEESSAMGTPGYQAPETVQRKIVSFAADVYSFGTTVGVLLFGKTAAQMARLVKEINSGDSRQRHLHMHALVATAKARLPVSGLAHQDAIVHLVQLGIRCMSYKPDARPSVIDMLQELQSSFGPCCGA